MKGLSPRNAARWASLRARLARVRELFPPTTLGVSLAAFAGFGLSTFAYEELDLVVLVLGFGTLGLVALANLLVLLAAVPLGIALRRPSTLPARTFETQSFAPSGFDTSTLAFLPLVSVELSLVAPQGAAQRTIPRDGRLVEELGYAERGVHARLERRVVVGDVFGLARVALRSESAFVQRVQPHLGGLRKMPTLRSMAHGETLSHPAGFPEGDRLDLRRYAPGDPARFLHWKVYARTRKLVVRVPERAIAPSERVIAYQVAGPFDEASAAAAIACLRSGALGPSWVFSADGMAASTTLVDEAVEGVLRSKGREGGEGLARFVATQQKLGPVSVVVFAPAVEGAWLDRVVAAQRAFPVPFQVVIGIDAFAAVASGSRLLRLLSRPAPVEGVERASFERVLSRLEAARSEVVVVERPTGRITKSGRTRSMALDAAKEDAA